MSDDINLKTCKWEANFHKTAAYPGGEPVDMWVLTESGGAVVSIGVPKGRRDIVAFVVKSCQAGQRVINNPQFTGMIEENYKP